MADLVAQALSPAAATLATDDPDLKALLAQVQADFGAALCGVVLYGSYSRGERDSLTDLYILIDDYSNLDLPAWHAVANRLLPPNVYQLELDQGLRCKYALMPLSQFERCVQRDFHSYFWARFAQPVQLLYARDATMQLRIQDAITAAIVRFHQEVLGEVGGERPAIDLWRIGLGLTYSCELRAESGKRAADLADSNAAYFSNLTQAYAGENDWPVRNSDTVAESTVVFPVGDSVAAERRWRRRRWWGKFLSVARLLKASATFDNGFEYLLWKIERHSGIYVEPGPWARKLPLLFCWPTFFRLYRLGAFR